MKSLLSQKSIGRLLAVVMIISCAFTNVTSTAFASSSDKKIDVWDFGGAVESDTDLYNNYITTDILDNIENVALGGLFTSTDPVVFGDLTITPVEKDRMYYPAADGTSNGAKSYGATNYKSKYSDSEYTNLGVYYANGTGGPTRRNALIDNVKAGEVITFYGGVESADSVLHFLYTGTDGEQDDTEEMSTNDWKKVSFVAQYDGQYNLYFDAAAGKPRFARVTRTPYVELTGTIEGADAISGYRIVLRNETTQVETEAALSGNTFTANIAPDYKYTVLLRGVAGYTISANTKSVTAEKSEIATGKSISVTVKEQTLTTLTGNISGFASDYDLSSFALKFVPTAEFDASETVEATVTDGAYTASIEPEVDYNVVLEGVNDYELTDTSLVNITAASEKNIAVALKTLYSVSGGFDGNGSDVSNVVFTNIDDNYTYNAESTADGYSIQLRAGDYSVSADCEGYVTKTYVSVSGDVQKDIYFLPETLPAVEYASDVYVGDSSKSNNYDSVKEAVDAVNRMPAPTSEAERITIHVAPGTYRDQVMLKTPYVSLVNTDPSQEVKLTWYYGIGYTYYSLGADGYYDEARAVDKFIKANISPKRWGGAFNTSTAATDFYAENIVFENSFNKYVTDEEIEDGVTPNGLEDIRAERKIYTDVTTKAATERASALVSEADRAEFYNCQFLGSQDTLFVQEKTHQYFNNCYIEGNTDYIFGDGDIVFDGCQLEFAGYNGSTAGGYIAVMKAQAENGVIFKDCFVTGSDKLDVATGNFGRPWEANAHVLFYNTVLEDASLISDDGWGTMSGVTPDKANYYEYGTKLTDNTSVANKTYSKEYTDTPNILTYLGDWTPKTLDVSATTAFTTAPFIVSSADLNIIYPGDTLTVGYELDGGKDSSLISWYRVHDDGTEEFIEGSMAYSSKSYKVTSKDQDCKIKVVVTPKPDSNVEAMSYTSETTVKEGTSGTGSTDKPIEDAVNIFIAGDSTVKTYTTSAVEGGWGEYLQSFFDDDYVNIVNYANGGRSSRNFINEGSLEKIKNEIKEGDYFLIQFGHNDCSNSSGYLVDRFVSLGEPDENGIYPTEEGIPGEIPESQATTTYDGTYPYYPYTTGTYKWYLKQYIDVAKDAGATPILVTPVTRMYFNSDGTIRDHHDATDTSTGTVVTSGNAYVKAVKQLGEETDTVVIDMFELTKAMAEKAYAVNGNTTLISQIMASDTDSTHCNKLGGLLEGSFIAEEIQALGYNISEYVKTPENLGGEDNKANLLFYVDKSGNVSAYAPDDNGAYTVNAEYWTAEIQSVFDTITALKDTSVQGDIDGDGIVTASDALVVLQYSLNSDLVTNASAADVDGDGSVTASDALAILQKSLNADYVF